MSKTVSKPHNSKIFKLVLFDAHAVIHRAYHALPDFATSSGEPTGALYGLSTMLMKIIGELNPDYMVACFDLAEPTHRHEVYEAYKAGRAKIDDALMLQLERAKDVFLAFGIPIYSFPGFEADDIIGTIVGECKGKTFRDSQGLTFGLDVIIASGDMDTLQLVRGKAVQVYTLKKGITDTVIYDEKKVLERFGFKPELLPDYKGLRGDPSDNIIGISGIGEKTATALVGRFGTIENIYKILKKDSKKLKEAGVTDRIIRLLENGEEEAIFSKTLATIRVDAPIHFTLPPLWRENLDLAKAENLFHELQFRTMGDRLKALLEKPDIGRKTTAVLSAENLPDSHATTLRDAFSPQYPASQHSLLTGSEANKLISQEAKELGLALWVIDSNISNPSIEDVFRFTETKDIKEAKSVIDKELDKRNVRKVFEEIEKPLISIIRKMNELGIKVEKNILDKLAKDYHSELSRLEQKIWQEADEEFNINSPKVLSEILFTKLGLAEKRQKKTPTGALSTRESELEKIRDKHPIISNVLEYRELAKLLSTYIDAIPPQLDANSRLHSTFIQAGTTTGRMASIDPNLQNIPIRTELGRAIRQAFVAEKGFKFVALDYSQIELRIAAILSQDERLIEIFKNNEDVHRGVAARVFKVKPEDVSIAERIKAKTINFGILYGMGINALRANLNTGRVEAQEFYNKYFETFTGLAKYLDEVKKEAERRGYTETMFGRRRYFSGFRSSLPYVRAQAERMAINAPIQGTQADLIKIAMRQIDEFMRSKGYGEDVRLVLQVHDELVYEISENLVDRIGVQLKMIMENVLPREKTLGVPIVADVHVGDNWGELK